MSGDPKAKDWWDKSHLVANSVAILLVPILVGYFGSEINSAIKDKEIGQRYVELAIGILKGDPDKESPALREWAINIVNANSPVHLNPKVREELKRKPLRPVKIIQPKTARGTGTNNTARLITDEKGNVLTDENGNPLITEDVVTFGGEPVTFGGKPVIFYSEKDRR